jgi:DNA-binding IclR family transcriptional regulator
MEVRMDKDAKADSARSVKSAERVLDLLETIGTLPQGGNFSGLSTSLGIPKSSLHALLDVLLTRGYVALDPATRRYSLGVRAWETGQAYQRHHSVIGIAEPVLAGIVSRINETAQLARLAGSENVYLAKVDSSHALRLQSEVGSRLSAHATGVGKALLAQLSDDEVRARFPGPKLPVHNANTIATTEGLLAELALTRARGFAIDNEEYTPGVFCIAVPVHAGEERASTAISVTVPVSRATVTGLATALLLLAEGSLSISQRCGSRQPDAQLVALSAPEAATAALSEMVRSGRYRLGFSAEPAVQAVR